MTLTSWSPVREMAALEVDRLNRMFASVLNGDRLTRGGWMPPVDSQETLEHDVVITAELPGMKREDVKVTLENSILTIAGERAFAGDAVREQYHRVERHYGAFSRSFTLPASVDGTRVDASYQDGVLTVKVPQRPDAKPRQIPING